jgi:peptidoglycan hydrolase-like protein with peptidoglycan-binding domain
MRHLLPAMVLAALTTSAAPAGPKSSQTLLAVTDAAINNAVPSGSAETAAPLIVRAEVLLGRAHFSPGEIDGEDGDNYRRALRAFQQAQNLPDTAKLDAATWSALTRDQAGPVFKRYTIAVEDVAGPFEKRLSASLVEMARLPGLSYSSSAAELAEKFHMSESLLRQLNPRANFGRAGEQIVVADLPPMLLRSTPHTLEAQPPDASKDNGPCAEVVVVDKPARNVRAYDKDGNLLAFFPATIGSEEKPAPTGEFKVNKIDWNPDFRYDPKFAWKGVKARRKLTISPGPNNPVGLVWIDLSAPSYGIHGTPQPEAIGKTESHGCIRLTNWDAVELAAMAHPGTTVRFEDQDSRVAPSTSKTAPSTANEAGAALKEPAPNSKDAKALVSTSSMAPSEYAQCISDLAAKQIVFDQVGDVREEGCQLSGAIRLAVVPTRFGDVAISGKPAMLCSFGRQFSTWVRDVAAPMTLASAGKKLAQIDSISAFSCRARYDKPGAVPSEHAKGDAIDIAAFVLGDNRRIPVKEQDTDTDRDLVRALRTTACGYFTTVLGPGSDSAHAEHFHFDSGLHGATPNYRICE